MYAEANERPKTKEAKKVESVEVKAKSSSDDLYEKVRLQGELVRDLKAKKASKVMIQKNLKIPAYNLNNPDLYKLNKLNFVYQHFKELIFFNYSRRK